MGQPHNLVRHPNMPAEAFRDMWDTLGSGKPWSGLVKNRRKDGDHYWVVANATPIQREGQAVGYLSVRMVPDRQSVVDSEKAYARMREQAESGSVTLGMRRGHLVRRGLAGQISGAFSGVWAASGWAGWGLALGVAAVATLATMTAAPVWASAAVLLGLGGHWLIQRQPQRRSCQCSKMLW